MAFNYTIQEGWIQKAPEIKTFDNGSMAVNIVISKYTGVKTEEGKNLNKFYRVRFSGKPADEGKPKTPVQSAAELKEGDRLVISGRFDYFKMGGKDGAKEELGEFIYADSFRVFGHNEPKQRTDNKGVPKPTADEFALNDDDIPF